MKKQSLTKNFIFQFAYQALILVIPLLMSPYLARTLKPDALGTYTYINSIASYFVIAANLGISVHGKRLISCSASDINLLRRSFWSLFYMHVVISSIVVIVYFAAIFILQPLNLMIYVLSGICVLSALFDITWLFYGLENFSSVVIKNAAVKVIECIFVFCLIKSPDDLWKYTLIIAFGGCVGQIVMLPQAARIVPPIKVKNEDLKQHIKPLVIFSVSVIASALYTIFDKTLLGILATSKDVAFYEYAHRIVCIPQTFTGIVGMVMLPRACKLVEDGEVNKQKKFMSYSFYITAFIGMGALFGISAIANDLAIIYYGKAFAPCGSIMIALSPIAYIVGTGSVLRSQYLIPNGFDKQFNMSIIYNAVINLILTGILIPIVGVYGAVVGTLSAEIFGLVYQAKLCKKIEAGKGILKTIFPFACIGIIMFCLIKFISLMMTISVVTLIIEVIVGATVYVILSVIYLTIFRKDLWKAFTAVILLKFKKNIRREEMT